MTANVRPGSSHPLGATVARRGVNFSVYSKNVEAVELLFFDAADAAQPARAILLDRRRHRTYHYWHEFVPGVKPGQLYEYPLPCPAVVIGDHDAGGTNREVMS